VNINPIRWVKGMRGGGQKGIAAAVNARSNKPWGPWQELFNDPWLGRAVAPRLYEALREAIPPIDGAINRLVMLDGVLRVEAESDRLQREFDDWMEGVKVNDMSQGFQEFYRLMGNEYYEQGFAVGEPTIDGKDVTQLWVADSKGIYFRRFNNAIETWYWPPAPVRNTRRDGTEQTERVLRNTWQVEDTLRLLIGAGYSQIEPELLIYAGHNCEADNPYGVSLMRSMEFVSRVLLTMNNSLQQTWDRFGNPAFNVTYKRKRKASKEELDTMRDQLASNLADTMAIKQQGNSADFVNAISADDELGIAVIGHDNQVLEIEMPARHILEQIVSKTGLASWMLGFHWSTAERLAQRQGEIMLQESRTRFTSRKPGLLKVLSIMLRARGVTWKPGDWQLVQDLPNIQDMVAIAQARFLNAQADMVSGGGQPGGQGGGQSAQGQDNAPKLARVSGTGEIIYPWDEPVKAAGHTHQHKAETYVEDSAALLRLERRAERSLQSAWANLYDDTLTALGLDAPKSAKAPDVSWVFNAASMLAKLSELQDEFVTSVGKDNPELAKAAYQAWLRGVANAVPEVGADAVDESARAQVSQQMQTHGLELLRNEAVRLYRNDIVASLEQGHYDGLSPSDVARELKGRFDAHGYDWMRLARSEIADAQGRGKLAQYAANNIEQYSWVQAGGACAICEEKAAGSPYTVGGGPVPMTDSHPNCRCTVMAAG